MGRLFSCFGKFKGRAETGEAGENAGAQAAEQATTSSNPSAIEGKFTFEELCGMTPNLDKTNLRSASSPMKFTFNYIEPPQNHWEDEVFRGTHHNQTVAIQRIRNQDDEFEEFEEAISVLRQANHPNLLKVIGHCIEDESRFVVYEFSNLQSLAARLFDLRKEPLDWNSRLKIALGCAKGLEYLHNTMDPPVIYRNIRANKVYLDDEFVPKLFDFGVPKKFSKTWVIEYREIDFLGYKAPEYIAGVRSNLLTDVYSFGVLLLVIITGREATDEQQFIADWARSTWKTKKIDLGEILDPRIKLRCPIENAFKYFELAVSCININPSVRPDILEVRQELERIASRPYVHNVGGSSVASTSSAPPS